MQKVRDSALKTLGELVSAGPPQSQEEGRGLLLSSRTNGGRALPEYFLVYFLLVDLLEFPHMGQWEKSAWTVPVRFKGRLYGVEHRKMGLGVFAPNLDPTANMSTRPTEEQEADSRVIATLISKAIKVAEPYFTWRAEQAAATDAFNVLNKSQWLFERYEFFRNRRAALIDEAKARRDEKHVTKTTLSDGTVMTEGHFPAYSLLVEAEWNAHAAIEAFFSWTEHVFIHLAILQGRLRTGEEVARIAEAEWKAKFKLAIDLDNPDTKKHYDLLLDLRFQIRNFMAHGAFGKRGEAFQFHSGAGAVPVLLTSQQGHKYSFTAKPGFDEADAIEGIEQFLTHLWSGPLAAAKPYIFSSLPTILTLAVDGTYTQAMSSEAEMDEFVSHLTRKFDNAGNMDW